MCGNGAVARMSGAEERRIHFGHKEGEFQSFLNDQILKAFESRLKMIVDLY